MTPAGRQRVQTFLADLTRQVESTPVDECVLLETAKASLQALVQHDDWLDDEYAWPDPARYQQYLLYCDPLRRFSVVSFVWGPGQQTPIHDHTTWGLVGMLRGAEISESFELRAGRPVAAAKERLEPGQVIMIRPALGDIHQVRNAYADRVSVSIHVYGGDIGAIERHVYLQDGGARPFTSGYANRSLPNLWGAA